MRYLLLLPFLVGCTNKSEPEYPRTEFRYNQRIEITEGFYAGMKGTVRRECTSYSDCYRTYEVSIDETFSSEMICNKRLKAIGETK
jgi:hypothetical protein